MSLKNQIQISNLLDTLKQYIDITTLNLNNPKPSSLADFIKRDFTRDINFEELNFIDFELEKKTETSEAIEEKVQMLYNYQKYSYYDIPFDNLKIFDDYLRIAQIFLKPLNPSDVSFLYDVNQHLHKKKIEEIFMQDDVKESFINSFGGQKLENNPALNFVIDSFQDFKTQLNKVEDLPVTTTSSLLEKESKFDWISLFTANVYENWVLNSILNQYIFVFLFIFILSMFLYENYKKLTILNYILFIYTLIILFNEFNSIYISHLLWDSKNVEDFLNETSSDIFFHAISPFITYLFYLFCIILNILVLGFCNNFLFKYTKDSEFSWLILFILISSLLLFFCVHLIEVFICLECIAFCSYILLGLEKTNKLSVTAGIQYLILSSIPASLFLLGLIFIYQNYATFSLINLSIFFENIFLNTLFENTVQNFYSFDMDTDIKVFENYVPFVQETLIMPVSSSSFLTLADMWEVICTDTECKRVLKPLENNPVLRHLLDYNFKLTRLSVEYNQSSHERMIQSISILSDDLLEELFTDINIKTIYGDVLNSMPPLDNLSLNYNFLSHNYFFLSLTLALCLILVNFAFKLTAAPFHIWAPIIYNNGPIASVSFLAIFSKLILISFLIYFLNTFFYAWKNIWSELLFFLSIASLLFGTLGAFNEKFIKRFFVYSSMTDIGFMLLGLSFAGKTETIYIFNYLFLYNISSIIIWFFLLYLRTFTKFLTNLQQILIGDIVLNIIFSLNIFSLAGIPPFGGFFVKLDIFICLLLSSNFLLSLFILIITVINFYYYLRLIKIIYFEIINSKKIINTIENEKLFIFSFLINFVCFYELFYQNSFMFFFETLYQDDFLEVFEDSRIVLANKDVSTKDYYNLDF